MHRTVFTQDKTNFYNNVHKFFESNQTYIPPNLDAKGKDFCKKRKI